MRSPHIDYVINSVTYGVKMPRVGTDTMTNLLIPLPPLAEQKRIVAKIEELLPYPHIMFDFKGVKHSFDQSKELQLTQSVENLERLGLLIKNSNVIELNYDYEKFRNHWFYKALGLVFEAESKINMKKYRIELTQMGQAFVSCCFEKQNAESDSQKQRTT